MDLHALSRKLHSSYAKNRPELLALSRRLYPRFVFAARSTPLEGEIPVFNFHDVEPQELEAQLGFLAANCYRTLDAAAFVRCLRGEEPVVPRSVLLTFDDGWQSLHTVAAPLLRRHGMQAVAFLIPGVMAARRAAIEPGSDAGALVTWQEVRENRDVVDFQSHSMWHHRVFVSSRIVDFVHPGYDLDALRLHVPVLQVGGQDNFARFAALGTPIYDYAPRLAGRRRFLDDESLREACVSRVAASGGEVFFTRPRWREALLAAVREHVARRRDRGSFEPEEALRAGIRAEIEESRRRIEAELPGARVHAFCFPWFAGSELAVALARQAGFTSSFWGVLPGRRTNRAGDDPFHTVRMPPDYIWRLPGEGRRSLAELLVGMLRKSAPGFLKGVKQAVGS